MKTKNFLNNYRIVLAIVLIVATVATIAIYFVSKSSKIDLAKITKEMKDLASLEDPSIEKFVNKGYVDITQPLEHDAGIDLRNSLGAPKVYVKTVRLDDDGKYYGVIYWKNRDDRNLSKQEFSTDNEARISIYDSVPEVIREVITKQEDGLNKVYAVPMPVNADKDSEEIFLFSFK